MYAMLLRIFNAKRHDVHSREERAARRDTFISHLQLKILSNVGKAHWFQNKYLDTNVTFT